MTFAAVFAKAHGPGDGLVSFFLTLFHASPAPPAEVGNWRARSEAPADSAAKTALFGPEWRLSKGRFLACDAVGYISYDDWRAYAAGYEAEHGRAFGRFPWSVANTPFFLAVERFEAPPPKSVFARFFAWLFGADETVRFANLSVAVGPNAPEAGHYADPATRRFSNEAIRDAQDVRDLSHELESALGDKLIDIAGDRDCGAFRIIDIRVSRTGDPE